MIAKKLRMTMAEKGVKQAELAEKSGVPQSSISSLLSGKVKAPRLDTLNKISLALGVPVSLFFGEPQRCDWLTPEVRRIINIIENMDEPMRLRVLADILESYGELEQPNAV